MKKFNSLSIVSGIFFASILLLGPLQAASVNIQVTVGNVAPTISATTLENPASDATTPTNDNANVTFQGTGTDTNGDQYYLLLCKTSAAPTPNNLAAPACNGGAPNQLCVSAVTNSGVQATCAHSVSGEAAQTQAWFAFVCDFSGGSLCSVAGTQGATAADPPYNINHAPTFNQLLAAPSANPGGSFVYTVLAANWTGGAGDADQGKLLVCSTNSITAGGACTATTLCSSAFTNEGSNLTCTFNDSANPVKDNGIYPAYTFIVDQHNYAATGTGQGNNVTYIINNVAPVVSNVVVNGGSNVTLTPNTTTASTITATITDQNSCQDLATNPVSAKLYRSSIGAGGCSATNSTNCYVIVSTSCTQSGADTCSGATDASVGYSCSVSLQYFTDPTDGNVSTNTWFADAWRSTVTAADQLALAGSFEGTAGLPGVEVNSLNSMTIAAAINYGSLSPGVTSGGGNINTPLSITNVGNVGLNAEAQGGSTGLCTDYPTCAGSVIPLNRQKWEFVNNTTAWSSGSNVLTSGLTTITLGITKPVSLTVVSKDIYWGLAVPVGQAIGSYTGATTVNSLTSAPGTW